MNEWMNELCTRRVYRSERVRRISRRCRWKTRFRWRRTTVRWPCTRELRWPSTEWTSPRSVSRAKISSSSSTYGRGISLKSQSTDYWILNFDYLLAEKNVVLSLNIVFCIVPYLFTATCKWFLPFVGLSSRDYYYSFPVVFTDSIALFCLNY